jgi:hypothetical protein
MKELNYSPDHLYVLDRFLGPRGKRAYETQAGIYGPLHWPTREAGRSREVICWRHVGSYPPFRSVAKAAATRLISTDGAQKIDLAQGRPQDIREIELTVDALPQEEA